MNNIISNGVRHIEGNHIMFHRFHIGDTHGKGELFVLYSHFLPIKNCTVGVSSSVSYFFEHYVLQ